jgi:glycosyltransferase involved in cell wall biosynthesis
MIGSEGERSLTIVVAGTSWDGVWQSERHLAMQLADRGPVLWVDPQISRLSPLRDGSARQALDEERLRPVAPNLLRLTPVTVPGVSRPVLRDLATRGARRALRRAVGAIGLPVRTTLVASLNNMLDAVPCDVSVFYGTDDYVAGAELMGTDPAWLQRCTERQLDRADIVIATSEVLADRWSELRSDIHVIPNGCDFERLAATDLAPIPDDVHLPRPIAGFVGHMSERIDLEMLDAVADTGDSLLLVGPRQPTFEISRLDALIARPNVQWVGAKRFAELPSYLRVIDAGLTPYSQSDFNRASFPLKTLDYLAAGRPVVASDLPAHRWLDADHVHIARSAAEFGPLTRGLLADRRSADVVRECRRVAAENSWEVRAAEIAALLDPGARVMAGSVRA